MAKINMKQVISSTTNTVKAVLSKAAPVAKVIGGGILAGVAIYAGAKYYKHNKPCDEFETESTLEFDEMLRGLVPQDSVIDEDNK